MACVDSGAARRLWNQFWQDLPTGTRCWRRSRADDCDSPRHAKVAALTVGAMKIMPKLWIAAGMLTLMLGGALGYKTWAQDRSEPTSSNAKKTAAGISA